MYINMLLTWHDLDALKYLADCLADYIVEYAQNQAVEVEGDACAGYVNQDR